MDSLANTAACGGTIDKLMYLRTTLFFGVTENENGIARGEPEFLESH